MTTMNIEDVRVRTTGGASIGLQRVIGTNWAVRREFEGPAMADLVRGSGPAGGWESVEEARLQKKEWRTKVCGGCFEQKSVSGSCACE